jgi:hypothetical protein
MTYRFRPALALLLSSLGLTALATDVPTAGVGPIAWHDDYHAGLDEAHFRGRMALVWFHDPRVASANARFERNVLQSPSILQLLSGYVAIKLPTDATAVCNGQDQVLLDHPALAEMLHSPGLAIIDMSDEAEPHFRRVVSVYPFSRMPISAEKLAVLLDLPRGTLTQRTLVFAVRTHPEQPASTAGHLSQLLTRETENHAWHQAQIMLQGHHNWNARFHAINAQVPGLTAREVCAEGWPGQTLVEAADDCVRSWRQSPGHWDAVRSRHTLFGYDMKRGANGIWYATGIFASP